jgi:hypothetical protein
MLTRYHRDPMHSSIRIAVRTAPLLLVAIGCSSDAQPTMCFGANLMASESNNYAFSSTITLPPVTVKPMSNLTFDWGGLTKDFLGHPLNPATDIVMDVLMIWDLPRADFETALNADALYPADLVVSPPLNLPISGATSAQLHQFLVNGTAISSEMFDAYFDAALYPPETTTFLVGVQSGTDLGRDMRMLQALQLDAASTVTDVAITDSSTKLKYTANLHSLTITGVPAGTPALTLDWSQMKTNALGAEFKDGYVTRAIVGHYTQTPAELEKKFLDLDRIATATYSADIGAGSTLDFTTLKDENGASFPGVDDSGTWLVGLFCGNCRNPAPWYMSILKPCSM